MKLFRLRFILLGLLLCVYHVWCLTCGTEFDDPTSSGHIADIVVIGAVSQTLPPNINHKYNATVMVNNRRDILKGDEFLGRGRGSKLLFVGQFGDEDYENCVRHIRQDLQYLFFLNTTAEKGYFKLSALPLSAELKKEFRRAKKEIKKIVCGGNNCVQVPKVNSRKAMKNRDHQIGKTLELNCRLKKKPLPAARFKWYKDGKEINHKGPEGFTLRHGKKGSRLKKPKAGLSEAGRYECVAMNVGGETRQQSVITVTGARPPEVGSRPLKKKKVNYLGVLKLKCRVKGSTLPLPEFKWYKNGEEITKSYMRRREGFSIRSKGYESRLRKVNIQQGDNGNYRCVARNSEGVVEQQAAITVVGANPPKGPKKKVPCGKEDNGFCFHNGTCMIMKELKFKYCECRPNYQGPRCQEVMFDKIKIAKLAQDRTLVIVGIVSGILLFIAICVASYFLAKRRRDQFHSRRRERQRGNIEDNIPQVYRPLIGCDEIDGVVKHCKMNGVITHKGTQTIETCFLGATDDGKTNLYINPLEGYTRPDNNSPRSRLTAVSLEGKPKGENHVKDVKDDVNDLGRNSRRSNSSASNPRNSNIGNRPGGVGDLPNDPSPQHTQFVFEKCKPVGAAPGTRQNDLGSSVKPPAFNLDESESDDEIQNKDVLTPLHISEDEGTRSNRNSVANKDKLDNNPKELNTAGVSKPPDHDVDVKDYSDTPTASEDIYASDTSGSYSDSDSSSTTEGCDSPNTAMQFDHSFSDPEINKPTYWNDNRSPEPRIESPYFSPNSKITAPPFHSNRSPVSKDASNAKESIPLRNMRGVPSKIPS